MKHFKLYLSYVALIAFFFTSCSKDDEKSLEPTNPEAVASLSFATVLNDLVASKTALKDHLSDFPVCSDAAPAYVSIILTGPENVGSMADPYEVDINPTPANYDDDPELEYFTEEDAALELTPGTYSLVFFTVHDVDGNILWTAATQEGELGNFVSTTLPLEIELGAGVKKYVDVEVLCFDDRLVNEYGFLFFDLETVEAIEFCLFANYCDENGRHFSASYTVDFWLGTSNTGIPLYTNVPNSVGSYENGDFYASPVCFALPNLDSFEDDEPYLYYEATLQDWLGNYGEVEDLVISGTLSKNEIFALFDGDENVDYEHIRFGCEETGEPPMDTDGDGVPNSLDDCPEEPGLEEYNGCPEEPVTIPGRDIVVFNDINIFDNARMEDEDNVQLVKNLVNYTTSGSRNEGTVVWIDRGRNARCFSNGECDNSGWATMRTTITNEGFTISDIFSTSGSITNIPAEVKIIFLIMPTTGYTVAEINTLKSFAAEGGRIIFIGEHDQFYLNIPIENQFLVNMGAVLTNTGGALDCGLAGVTIPETSNREHPIMNGIDELTVACASVIVPGEGDFALFYDTTNTHVLAGVAKIDTAPISEIETMGISKRQTITSDPISNPKSATGY